MSNGHQGPMGVYEEPNDTRHIEYQFHSVFCTENEFKVANLYKAPTGCPMGVQGPIKYLMIQGILGIISTQFSKESAKGNKVDSLQFSAISENDYKVAQPFRVHIRRPRGVPWASRALWGL